VRLEEEKEEEGGGREEGKDVDEGDGGDHRRDERGAVMLAMVPRMRPPAEAALEATREGEVYLFCEGRGGGRREEEGGRREEGRRREEGGGRKADEGRGRAEGGRQRQVESGRRKAEGRGGTSIKYFTQSIKS
jgi:hypothetical protein